MFFLIPGYATVLETAPSTSEMPVKRTRYSLNKASTLKEQHQRKESPEKINDFGAAVIKQGGPHGSVLVYQSKDLRDHEFQFSKIKGKGGIYECIGCTKIKSDKSMCRLMGIFYCLTQNVIFDVIQYSVVL